MTDWAAFAGVVGLVLVLLLGLARASQGYVTTGNDGPDPTRADADGAAVADSDRTARHAGRDPGAAGSGDGQSSGASRQPSSEAPGRSGSERPSSSAEPTSRSVPSGDSAVAPTRPDGTQTDREVPSPTGPPGDHEAAAAGPRAPVDGADGTASTDDTDPPLPRGVEQLREPELTTGALLANVALSQGLFAGLLIAGAVWTQVPPAALGLDADSVAPAVLLAGLGVGVGLYLANEAGAAVGERFGLGGGEALREALAPETPTGWAVLLFVVLPVVAGFEELLFRGALVGALAVGFDVSPWLLAAGSSVAFALGHGAQGRVGIVVTGLLGFALAATFVLTGSLPAVILAHYLVNALEFLLHEGLGIGGDGTDR